MRIGELAEATGTTTKTLRFYEAGGLLPPPTRTRTRAGYRVYGEEAVARLDFIRRGRAAGLTSPRSATSSPSVTPATPPADTYANYSPTSSAPSTPSSPTWRHRAQLHDAATNAEPDTCPPEQVCRYL